MNNREDLRKAIDEFVASDDKSILVMGKLNTYYILYFDVLGYRNKIFSDERGFLSAIKELFKRSTEKNWHAVIRTFSDNVMVSVEDGSDGALRFLCHYASRIQELILREHGLLLRGAITKGNLYFDNQFVYGTGLVQAVELEENVAVYPRIIIDRKLGNEDYILRSRHTIFSDKDGYSYINFLNYYDPHINPNGERDGNWIQLKRSIERAINEMSSNQDLTPKRLWLSSFYDNIKSRYNLD